MQMQIQLNGITYATPNALANDGDMQALVNLRKKDGTLQPVTEGTPIGTLTRQYDYIYLHPVQNKQCWIGILANTLYTDILDTPVEICRLDAKINRIKHIGNTLIALTEKGIFYFLYKNNTYKPLGYKPPFPYLTYEYNIYPSRTYFTDFDNIPDVQAAMEALIVKTRWNTQNEYASLLCGTYMLRYALKLYDGSYIRHSSPILINPYTQHPYYVNLYYDRDNNFVKEFSYITIRFYTLSCTLNPSLLLDWKDIITSIDIFITNEMGMIAETFKNIDQAITEPNNPNEHQIYIRKSLYPQDIDNNRITSTIQETGNFYLIKSIPVTSDKTTTITCPEKADITTMQNIIHNEQLPVDSFSHHNITANYAYTYNQRLHIANIKTIYFNGFGLPAFTGKTKEPAFRPGDTTTYETVPNAYITIYIDDLTQQTTSQTFNVKYIDLNPLFSYPDPRAYKAVITFCDNANRIYKQIELPLKPHNNLNIAYYLSPDLSPIAPPEKTGGTFQPQNTSIATIEDNKLKVSAISNPFIFPNENTYTTASNITAMATNSTPVSEGQFGQYPLYLFTQTGIYIMQTGSDEITYSSIVPVAEEIALKDTVTPVAGAVFFLTPKGAHLIAGSKTQSISDTLNAPLPATTTQHEKIIMQNLFPALPDLSTSFLTFIQLPRTTVQFNYRQNEIIIMNESKNYAYVFNFHSNTWHITTHTFTPIQNTYPHTYGIRNLQILDIADETHTPTPVLLFTRPMKLGTQQYKHLHRQILRSLIINPAQCGLFTFSSNDATNFCIKSNRRIPPGSHIDPDTCLIARNTYRYFTTLFIGTLSPQSRINYLEATIYNTFDNNDKLK